MPLIPTSERNITQEETGLNSSQSEDSWRQNCPFLVWDRDKSQWLGALLSWSSGWTPKSISGFILFMQHLAPSIWGTNAWKKVICCDVMAAVIGWGYTWLESLPDQLGFSFFSPGRLSLNPLLRLLTKWVAALKSTHAFTVLCNSNQPHIFYNLGDRFGKSKV